MIRSRKNELLNILDAKEYITVYTDSFAMKHGEDERSEAERFNLRSDIISSRRYSKTQFEQFGITKDTPTFVINTPEEFENFTVTGMSGIYIGKMFSGVLPLFENPPFDNFIIEYKTPVAVINEVNENGDPYNDDINESYNFYVFNTVEVEDEKKQTITCITMNIINGRLLTVINPVAVSLLHITELNVVNETSTEIFISPFFTLTSAMGDEKLTQGEMDYYGHRREKLDQTIELLKLFEKNDFAEDDGQKLIDQLNERLRYNYLTPSINDMAWVYLNFIQLYSAVNVESVVVTAPKLPPRARKKLGKKYNTHNDFIVLKPKATVTKYDSFKGDGSTGSGTPKRAHARRGHLRHLKSGKTTYVQPCYIKGGAAGQEYII